MDYKIRVMADRAPRSAIDSLLANNGLPPPNPMVQQWEQKTLLGRGSGCGRRHRPCILVQRPTGDEAVRLEAAKRFALELSIQRALQKQTQQNHEQQMLNMRRAQAQLLLSRVYVGGIGSDANEDALKRAFSVFGPMRSLDIGWDAVANRHKGFCFVEYDLPEAATLAIDSMNGQVVANRTLRVSRPSNVPQPVQLVDDLILQGGLQSTIFVCNVHMDLTDPELRSVFEAFGPVKFCALVPDPKRPDRHRGFGFIEYEMPQAAVDAIASMNNFDLGGQLIRVGRAITNPSTIIPGLAPAGAVQPPGAPPAPRLPPASAVAAATISSAIISQEASRVQTAGLGRVPSGSTPPPPGVIIPQVGQVTNQVGAAHLDTAPVFTEQLQQQSEAGTEQLLESDPSVRGREARQLLMQRLMRASPVVVLRNLVASADELDDQFQEDVTEECARFGTVQRLIVYVPEGGASPPVSVFVRFDEPSEGTRAVEGLNGRFFGGRRVIAEYYDEQLFESGDYIG